MARKVEIFRAGKQTDSAGVERDWTVSDLDTIAGSYNPEYHEAPVCIGHPKDNAPAFAWIKRVTREGESLFAEIGDEAPEFSEWLEAKRFKKRSISLYPDLSIRHLAFLGAQPPAVKGLKDFSEGGRAFPDAKGEAVTLDFADWPSAFSFQSIGRLFQSLRDRLLVDKDKETADAVLPQYEIDALKAMQADPEKHSAFQEHEMTQQEHEAILAAEQAKTKAAEAKALQFSEQLTAEQAKAAGLTAQLAAIKAEAQDKALSDFCEGQIKAGKMLPTDKPAHLQVMKALAGLAEIDFAEGDKTTKKTPLAIYQERLAAGPKVIEFSETATKETSAAPAGADKIEALVKAKMKANASLSYNEASRQVYIENPEITRA